MPPKLSARLISPVLGLLFLSGFTSLVYQMLWMRELALVFGSSSYATSGTLAVFFGGLAIGGFIWSRRAPNSKAPLKEYGLLEIGIGLSGILYFGLLPLYASIYSPLYGAFGNSPALLLFVKLLLAAVVLLPPAILMGGNIPLICQQFVNDEHRLGKIGSLIYAANTFGAACGALAAGFWLPAWLGFQTTYLIAVVLSVAIGVVAYSLGKNLHARTNTDQDNEDDFVSSEETVSPAENLAVYASQTTSISQTKLLSIAFASGALALALEVLWTRMFQQVLQNSVYTFSVILVTFLIALALGSFISNRLVRFNFNPQRTMLILLAASALAALLTPFMFYHLTDGMRYMGSGEAWSSYLPSVFAGAAVVLLIPGIIIGTVFPYLFRIAERNGEAGRVVGQLAALNTSGAIVGSLLAGFVLLSILGLWSSLLLVAVLYLLLAVWIAPSIPVIAASTVSLVVAITVANPSVLPGVRLNAETEELLGNWEGPDGYVAVIEREGSKRIKINNFYALGSTAAQEHEQNQTFIPLMPHASPERLFYLGMGTGITAGAGLLLPSEKVTVAELVPDVITAAKTHFNEESMGLFSSDRAEILARDGRNELLGSKQKYDAILADLFVPWRAGVSNLYSRDHYQVAKNRLTDGGVYVQWVPLYQMTEVEFWTLIRTFVDVFPHVHAWRGDFYSDQPILALVGSLEPKPLDPNNMVRNGQHLSQNPNLDPATFLAVTLPFYVGNLGESREIIPDGPMHTDDRPYIEYQAPISHRNARAGQSNWFTDAKLTQLFSQIHSATPVEEDPYLSLLGPTARRFVSAGLNYHTAVILNNLGREREAEEYFQAFRELLSFNVAFETQSSGSTQIEE